MMARNAQRDHISLKSYGRIEYSVVELPQARHQVVIVDEETDLDGIESLLLEEGGSYYCLPSEDKIIIFVRHKKPQELQSKDKLRALEDPERGQYITSELIKTILRGCKSVRAEHIAITNLDVEHTFRFVSLLNQYNYKKHFKSSKPFQISSVEIVSSVDIQDEIQEANLLSLCQNYANFLAALPANICNTHFLAKEVEKIASLHQACQADFLDASSLQTLGMNCLLAVGAGSPQETMLASLYFNNAPQKENKTVLIGKGLVYDTGGVNLKPTRCMQDAHKDMHGAAVALSIIKAAMLMDLPVNLMVILPLAENSCGGKSMRPGDIITSLSGKTIRITHTDAEGRLALCDAMTYAQEHHHANTVITIATLTGTAVCALGRQCYALFSNYESVRNNLMESAIEAVEPCWPLPLYKGYEKDMDDKQADLVNANLNLEADTILAAHFLNKFVKDGCKFAHLDIAATWTETHPTLPIKTLLYFLKLENS